MIDFKCYLIVNVHMKYKKLEELYPLLGNAIDVFMLINDLGKQTMKENEVLEYL